MTSQEIKELLLYGESIMLECKECRSDIPKSVWETYSAFANTRGGIILLGVHEDLNEPDVKKRFAIKGVADVAKIIGDFWNIINIKHKQEGLTLAGLFMFGKGLSIKERFDNIRMDYIDKTHLVEGQRWSDRLTYDGTWENNLYNFFHKVVGKLTEGLNRPFVMKGIARENDTPLFRAIREAVTNMIIHADYMITGVLRVEKYDNHFYFSNPGNLRLPVEKIYEGNHTAARNPKLQDMFRMIGYGENIGSGFPTILDACRQELWRKPELKEFSDLRTVDLKIWMVSLMPPEITSEMESMFGNAFKHLSAPEKQVMATALLEDEVSNSDMQILLEKNPIDAGTILSQLVEKHLLIPYGKGRWTMYQPNRHFLQDTAQVAAQDTAQDTAQVAAQDTAQEKSIRIQHQEKLIVAYCKEPRTLKEIAAYLKYKNTRWLRETYITPLLGKKLWMTLPDKPRSGNQKYTSVSPKK